MASAAQDGFIANLTPTQRFLAGMVLASTNFMVVLDTTIANVSIPHISGDLGIAPNQGTWVITSYAVAEAICVPLTGWLAQRFGSVRMFTACILGFGLFSFLCGLATTLGMLVAFRIGQGVCGGPLMPLSQALMMRVFLPHQRAKAMGLWAMTTLLGPAMGPIIGGFVSDGWSWHWIFLINIPVALACGFASITLLRDVETARIRVPIDKVGLFLLLLWIGALQIMIDIGREHDWFSDPLVVTLAIVAGIGFVAFVIWELTEEHPIVNLRIFRNRGFTAGVLALAFCFGAYFASIVVVPQWLQLSMGYTATYAGLATALTAIAALVTSQLAARMVPRVDPRRLVTAAFLWLAIMSFARVQIWSSEASFFVIAAPQFIQGLAMPFFFVSLTTITLTSVKPEETASAAGLQNFLRTMAMAISTSLVLTEWDRVERSSQTALAGALHPETALATLSRAGLTDEQARAYLAQMVQAQAQSISINHIFLVTGFIFLGATLLIWLGPRLKAGGAMPSGGGH